MMSDPDTPEPDETAPAADSNAASESAPEPTKPLASKPASDAPPSDPAVDDSSAARRSAERSRRRGFRRGGSDKNRVLRSHDGAMVTMEDVRKVYTGGTVALDGVSIDVKDGEFAFIVGQSGSGKSTFIRLLTKELEATDGRIVVGGRDLTKMRPRKVPELRRAIGCVFQDYKLLPERNAYQNVAYAMQVIGAPSKEIKRSVPDVLELVGLEEKGTRMPGELSGGEQQRVSIARAVVNQPSLLIADEPTGNLDPETSAGIMQVLYRINQAGTTVLMATHDRDLVNRMEMRVVELAEGKIVRDQKRARYAPSEE